MPFKRPENSPAHIALGQMVASAKLDPTALKRLLWLINAHPDLISHARIFDNIRAHFASATFKPQNLAWASNWVKDLPEWIRICDWVGTHSELLGRQPELNAFRYVEPGKHPLVGSGVERHAICAGVWNTYELAPNYPPARENKTGNLYFRLQGHALCAYIDSRARRTKQNFYEIYDGELEAPIAPMRTSPVGLALRELSLKLYSDVLLTIPNSDNTWELALEFQNAQFFCPEVDEDTKEIALRHLAAIRRFFRRFRYVVANLPLSNRHRKRAGSGMGGGSWRHGFIRAAQAEGIYFEANDNTEQDPDLPRTIGCAAFSTIESNLDQIESSGIAPQDVMEKIMVLYTATELRSQLFGSKLQDMARESAAQKLPFFRHISTPQEIRAFNNRAENWLQTPPNVDLNSAPITDQQLAALLGRIMLCLGQSAETAWDMQCLWISRADDIAAAEPIDEKITLLMQSEDGSFDSATVIGFLMPALQPDYSSELDADLLSLNRSMRSSFLLLDYLGVGQQLMRYLKKVGRKTFENFGITIAQATEVHISAHRGRRFRLNVDAISA